MSNDNKYVRLYPDRAVASLRNRAVNERDALLKGGNLAGASLWTDALDFLDSLGFPPDEPLFLLRGQDELAPEAVRAYADAVERERGAFAGQGLINQHLHDFADAMEAWPHRKLPD